MNKSYKLVFMLLFAFCFAAAYSSENEESYTIQNLIADINSVQAPVVRGPYLIFTADKNARFTGIAFDFENFSKVHTFERIVTRDVDGEPVDSILFYLCKIPEKVREISYKLIIDGVWTCDPLNDNKYYSYEADTYFSVVKIDSPIVEKTESVSDIATNTYFTGETRFVYQGEPGQKIRLGGSFTNWDSFIYQLDETSPGFYELTLALPRGKYFYAYYKGTTSFVDATNPDKAYTKDGKIASVLTVN